MTESDAAPRVAVVGAGITGLAAALRLTTLAPQAQIDVFDAGRRAGGLIRTERRDGFLVECGPDSFITNKPDGLTLCDELGVSDQLIGTSPEHRRSLVLRNGQPRPVPEGFMLMAPTRPTAILKSPILSIPGRVRLLAERFVPRRRSDDDESLADFVVRRFGRETFDRLVQPLVGGIYTSDPARLSLRATLPRFVEMERRYGSVIRAVLSGSSRADRSDDGGAGSGSGARYGLFVTHRDGLGAITERCVEACRRSGRVAVQLGRRVQAIRSSDTDPSCWRLDFDDVPSETYDAVIVTLPAHAGARLLHESRLEALRDTLEQFEYASTAIVVTAHRLADFTHPLDAFGLVIPEIERRKVLAVSFSSRKFPGRAPDGHILLRTFVGGAMHPELLDQDESQLEQMVVDELRELLGLRSQPLFAQTVWYRRSMPQYYVGHADRVAATFRCLESLPGLELAGSTWHGVGIPDSIRSGREAAERVAHRLETVAGPTSG